MWSGAQHIWTSGEASAMSTYQRHGRPAHPRPTSVDTRSRQITALTLRPTTPLVLLTYRAVLSRRMVLSNVCATAV